MMYCFLRKIIEMRNLNLILTQLLFKYDNNKNYILYSDTPKSWFILHWLSYMLAAAGVILLLVGRGHYTVDVVIAYILVTRLW